MMNKLSKHIFFQSLLKWAVLYTSVIFLICCNSQKIDIGNSYHYKILNKETYKGFPEKTWSRYDNIENEGWSIRKLGKARKYFNKIDSAAAMLVHKGAVVFAWGDVNKKFNVHSIRKSFLFSLYGIHEHEGTINLNSTIGELGIDDKNSLTNTEKQSKIIDLLKCRSGIYHKAAYEAPIMEKLRPARNSHKPGEFYYYNNWDFNVLGVIFEKETRTKIFEEFKKRIASPLQMEDYIVKDGHYVYDSEKSIHPAYPFVMTANDMARFGLLYLNNGKWKNEQLIPREWIKKATAIYSYGWGYGVGFKWDVLIKGALKKYGTYQTSGYKGHRIMVIPKLQMVFVHRVNTFDGTKNVPQKKIETLLKKIIHSYKP